MLGLKVDLLAILLDKPVEFAWLMVLTVLVFYNIVTTQIKLQSYQTIVEHDSKLEAQKELTNQKIDSIKDLLESYVKQNMNMFQSISDQIRLLAKVKER